MNNEHSSPADRSAVDVSLLLLRVIVGVIFAAHGAQKLFGVWGGPGLAATGGRSMDWVRCLPGHHRRVLWRLGFILDFFAVFSRVADRDHDRGDRHGARQEGLLSDKGGFEYNLALIGLLLPIFICGPGKMSIGRLFIPKSAKTGRPVVVLE